MIIPFAAGVIAASLFVAWMMQTKPGPSAAGIEDGCDHVAIILWEVIEGDTESELADLGGGQHGISHTSIDLCELDADGEPLMIECYPREGVTRSRLDKYGDRRHAIVVLTGEDAAHVRGAVTAQIGRPFDPLGMLSGLANPEALMCSTLVYMSLPKHLRERVDAARPEGAIGEAVSPAQLALAFGTTVGGDPVHI